MKCGAYQGNSLSKIYIKNNRQKTSAWVKLLNQKSLYRLWKKQAY